MNKFSYDRVITGIDTLRMEIFKLKNNDYSVIEFPLNLKTKKEIFSFAKNIFTLDPMLGDIPSWDGLSDSISGGCYISNQNLVIIIKRNIDKQSQLSKDQIIFLEILFQIKNEQLPIDIKIYLYIQEITKE